MSSKSTRANDEQITTLEELREEYGEELEKLAESDLPAAWVAEAALEDGDDDAE